MLPWLLENRSTYESIVIQEKGAPASSLIPTLELYTSETGEKLPLMMWPSTEVANATALMFDHCQRRTLQHLTHPGLDIAALSAAVRVLSRSAFEIDVVKSPTEPQPLQAAIGALWGLNAAPPIAPQVFATPTLEEIDSWTAVSLDEWLNE